MQYVPPKIEDSSKMKANEGGCCATSCGGSPMAPPDPDDSETIKRLKEV